MVDETFLESNQQKNGRGAENSVSGKENGKASLSPSGALGVRALVVYISRGALSNFCF